MSAYKYKDDPGFVFSYQNPDTDGVACAIAYAFTQRARNVTPFEPIVFGQVSAETSFALDFFRCAFPRIATELPARGPIALVDTHQVKQMPIAFDLSRVVEIIDHHPDGDPEAFASAGVQNEKVGAAATLLYERLQGVEIPRPIAGLLAAAILSNTLNFRAPSTTERDRLAFAAIAGSLQLPSSFARDLLASRDAILEGSTEAVLDSDVKAFEIAGRDVWISQVELGNAQAFLDRPDLSPTVAAKASAKGHGLYLVNVVDLYQSSSTLISGDAVTERLLHDQLDVAFVDGRGRCSRILLRKTDLVPAMIKAFGKRA